MKKLLLFSAIFAVSLTNAITRLNPMGSVGDVPNPNPYGKDIYTNKSIPKGYEVYELATDQNGNCPRDYQLIPAKCVLKESQNKTCNCYWGCHKGKDCCGNPCKSEQDALNNASPVVQHGHKTTGKAIDSNGNFVSQGEPFTGPGGGAVACCPGCPACE